MKKKWYKKWWVWVLLGIFTIGIIGSGTESELKDNQKQDGQSEVKDETTDEVKEDSTNDVVEDSVVKNEDSTTNDLLAWEFIILSYFPKTDCQLIKDTIPGYTDNLEVIKAGSAQITINTEYNETFYIAYYIAGEDEGKIAAIDTSETNYKVRTRLYPKKDIEYKEITIEELRTRWNYDNTYNSTINKNEIEYGYYELECTISYLSDHRRDNDMILIHYSECSFGFAPQTVDTYMLMKELNLRTNSKVLIKVQIISFDIESNIIVGLIHNIELIN